MLLVPPEHSALDTCHLSAPRFVPMLPQPQELATVIRHLADYRFGDHDGSLQIKRFQNGTAFTRRSNRGTKLTLGVHRPLCPERGMPTVPLFPCVDRNLQWFSSMLLKEGGDGGLSYLYVLGTKDSGKFLVRVYVLQDGVWCLHTAATCQPRPMHIEPKAVLIHKKIYMPSGNSDDIIVLDMTTSIFSTIQLPQGVRYNYFRTMLSPADDASGVYLVHINEFQLHIWLSKGDNWLLVDTICLRMLDHTLEDEHSANAQIIQVGDNAEYVFLWMTGRTLYLDVMRKAVHKVHEMPKKDGHFSVVKPFMMLWPPIFPVLKDDPSRNAI
ncbi:hypothetical protein CFC21_091123 [Triticum aestivum]|uniref:F-box protein AT5G49610-like beta-propeller domain-containing protein n=2 Tax=Triticum aestivum TaxID=4565 RepID=A0A9R1LFN5_WHEAT|nr:uncharacterized protein LOC123140838 [Triticum aestivum]XP_044416046.1 uncharacterized protein LOC123140838 [Triticum aestivum]KAF7087966.1 hypothetical protein CFC21_091122 [Triticum aestivum]KAF7087967.1 hypothetical protein CFC21_091123 [Triticum aestivum]